MKASIHSLLCIMLILNKQQIIFCFHQESLEIIIQTHWNTTIKNRSLECSHYNKATWLQFQRAVYFYVNLVRILNFIPTCRRRSSTYRRNFFTRTKVRFLEWLLEFLLNCLIQWFLIWGVNLVVRGWKLICQKTYWLKSTKK